MPSPQMLERIGRALDVPAESFLLPDDDDDEPERASRAARRRLTPARAARPRA